MNSTQDFYSKFTCLCSMIATAIALIIAGATGNVFAKGVNPLDSIESKYQKIKTFKGRFTQKIINPDLDKPETASGLVFYKKGGKMRFEYKNPQEQLLVTDGNLIWLYDPDLENVSIIKAGKLLKDNTLKVILGLDNLKTYFKYQKSSKRFADKKYNVINLMPKKKWNQLATFKLAWVKKDGFIYQLAIINSESDYRLITFDKVTINPSLKQNLFQFTITKSMEVVNVN